MATLRAVECECGGRRALAVEELSDAEIEAIRRAEPPAEAYRGDTLVDMMDKPRRALPAFPQAQQQQQEDRLEGMPAA